MFNSSHPPGGGNHYQMLPDLSEPAQQSENLRVAKLHRTPLFGKMQRNWCALSPFCLRSNNPVCDFDSLEQIQNVRFGSPLQLIISIDCTAALR